MRSRHARRLPAARLLFAFAALSSAPASSAEFAKWSAPKWTAPWTALTIAPSGAWGVGTGAYSNQAFTGAIANCRRMNHTDIGCGYQSVSMQAGWSVFYRCGDRNIIAAESEHEAAHARAAARERELRAHYDPKMPPCRHVLTVNEVGVVTIAKPSELLIRD